MTAILWSSALQQHIKTLQHLGFHSFFQKQLETLNTDPIWRIGRISQASRGHFHIMDDAFHTTHHPLKATARAHLMQEAHLTTGDWVLFSQEKGASIIEQVFERHTALTRARAGNAYASQVIASNVDVVFIVSSMNQEFNLSRLERYLVAVWNSGATPIIVLSKKDLTTDPDAFIQRAHGVAMGVSTFAVSSSTGEGAHDLMSTIEANKTYAFVGSSGVGKSTLHNLILGQDVARTQDIRTDDDEGRHTTTHRYLTCLPQGGMLIDTPGMREFGLWYEQEDGVQHTFADIEALADACKFRDCSHHNEPGCAIFEALAHGTLKGRRLRNYQKLQRELVHQQKKQSKSRSDDKALSKRIKRVQKRAKHRKS